MARSEILISPQAVPGQIKWKGRCGKRGNVKEMLNFFKEYAIDLFGSHLFHEEKTAFL